jgi:hypothetical protein
MPRYWLTTHWPPQKPNPIDPFHIHIQDRFKKDLKDLQKGDKILFYEFKSGPNVVNDRGEILKRRERGREGVVCEADLATDIQPRPNYVPERFEGKGVRNFCWEAFTENRRFGFVPKAEVNRVLRYAAEYTLQGFNGGRGIKEISPEQYAELHALFAARNGGEEGK